MTTRLRWTARRAALALALFGCAGEEDEQAAGRRRCLTLRDHLVELRVGTAVARADAVQHREAMTRALGEDFVDRCRQLPTREIQCALAAGDVASATECSTPEAVQ